MQTFSFVEVQFCVSIAIIAYLTIVFVVTKLVLVVFRSEPSSSVYTCLFLCQFKICAILVSVSVHAQKHFGFRLRSALAFWSHTLQSIQPIAFDASSFFLPSSAPSSYVSGMTGDPHFRILHIPKSHRCAPHLLSPSSVRESEFRFP